MAGGRPTDYTEDLGDLVCDGICRKIPLARLCDEDDSLPTPRTVYKWLRVHPEFVQNYTRAKEDQADYLAEECLEIADHDGLEPADKRIRVDTRKWLASKFQPKKYGDKQFVETKDTTEEITDEDLNAKIIELMDKFK
jgi:hypothetical protein